MKRLIAALLFSTGLSAPAPASAYPVDCAIFLCLAGGWPASTECAHARAVFIARITPWPIEPPLQIWNCPMQASSRFGSPAGNAITISGLPVSRQWSESHLPPSQAPFLIDSQADVDVSDPVSGIVRSIRVFHLRYEQRRGSDDNCFRSFSMKVGRYDEAGHFAWIDGTLSAMPKVSEFEMSNDCRNYRFRSVLVNWHDYMGRYAYEEVRY